MKNLRKMLSTTQTGNVHNKNEDESVKKMSLTKDTIGKNETEIKKDLLKKILKTHKLLEKYISSIKNNPYDKELKLKLEKKIPQFEHAIAKLKHKKEVLKFHSQSRSFEKDTSNPKDFTLILDSTAQDGYGFTNLNNKSGNTTCNESFTKSVRSLLNSMKTDNLSMKSNQQYLKELQQNTMAENEAIFDEKIEAINKLLQQLKDQ